MSNIISFRKIKASDKHKGSTLCKNNHHKWVMMNERRFDTKSGKLVTSWRCSRCGKLRNKAL